MSTVHAADAVIHDMFGFRFTSFASPSQGSKELCAWRLDVPAGKRGVPHTVSREEVLYVLSGTLVVALGDSFAAIAGAEGQPGQQGDAIVIPPGTTLRVDNPGDESATAWVTTSAGLEAILPDGSTVSPPWVR